MILHTSKQKKWKKAEAYIWEKQSEYEKELINTIREKSRELVVKRLFRM